MRILDSRRYERRWKRLGTAIVCISLMGCSVPSATATPGSRSPQLTETPPAASATHVSTTTPVASPIAPPTPSIEPEDDTKVVLVYDGNFNDLVWSPDGTKIAGVGSTETGGFVLVVDVATQTLLLEENLPNSVLRVDWSADGPQGELIGALENQGQEIMVWRANTYERIVSIPREHTIDFQFSHNGDLLAIGGGFGVSIWNIATSEFLVDRLSSSSEVLNLGWSPDDEMLAFTTGTELFVLSLSELTPTLVLSSEYAFYEFVDWAPNSLVVAVSGAAMGKLTVLSSQDYTIITETEDVVYQIGFSHDGSLLAAREESRESILIIDPRSGTTLLTLSNRIQAFAWSPIGTELASARRIADRQSAIRITLIELP